MIKTHNIKINFTEPQYSILGPTLKKRLIDETWEASEISSLKSAPSNLNYLELGGCIGVTASFLNKRLEKPANHVVIEPNPQACELMELVKKDNGSQYIIEQKIVVANKTDSEISFWVNKNHIMNSQLSPVGTEIKVKTETIDSLEKKYNIEFNGLIMDIEGEEYNILPEYIKSGIIKKFKHMIIEFHYQKNNLIKEIVESIIKLGYSHKLYPHNTISFSLL